MLRGTPHPVAAPILTFTCSGHCVCATSTNCLLCETDCIRKQWRSGKIFHLFNLIQIWTCFLADYIIIMNICLHESASFSPQLGLCVFMCGQSTEAQMQDCGRVCEPARPPPPYIRATCSIKMFPKASAVSQVTHCPLTSTIPEETCLSRTEHPSVRSWCFSFH